MQVRLLTAQSQAIAAFAALIESSTAPHLDDPIVDQPLTDEISIEVYRRIRIYQSTFWSGDTTFSEYVKELEMVRDWAAEQRNKK
jgi:hypothetical protein